MTTILEVDPSSIQNESDVEQKFLYSLLTRPTPWGLGIDDDNLDTKPDIRDVTIGKGTDRKTYYPDYIVSYFGIPILTVEAKSPDEDVRDGFREVRLYATEINSQFGSGKNPLRYIISSNFNTTLFGRWDNEDEYYEISYEDIFVGNETYSEIISFAGHEKLSSEADSFIDKHRPTRYYKPKEFLGGSAVQNIELSPNGFGRQLSIDFQHIFDPRSKAERAYIVNNAYVPSERRRRYVDSIDRIIDAAKPPSMRDPITIEDTEQPREIIEVLEGEEELTDEIILLIGRVGSGKSTFVDYLREVALPDDLLDSVLWAHVDMNAYPSDEGRLYDWTCKELIEDIASQYDKSFETGQDLLNLFHPEVKRLKEGPLQVYEEGSRAYRDKLYEEVKNLIDNDQKRLKAYFRHLGAERSNLPIIVLDNVDRGDRDSQLEMFQLAQWLQHEFQALIIMPIREQTYDNHKDRPPLDTAMNNLIFRIESPPFQEVLTRRIDLAMKDVEDSENEGLFYHTSSGARVKYSPEDQVSYLQSLRRSLFEYDSFARRMIVGLSGRNIRQAMRIFLDFCRSGHISNDQILNIKAQDGKYSIPYNTMSRVVFKTNSRYFDDEKGYVKNLFDLNREDSNASHLTRYVILKWLEAKEDVRGDIGVEGFHKLRKLKDDLHHVGLERDMVHREVEELVRFNCILTEHLRTDDVDEEDLIRLAPAGETHLDVVNNIQYISAVSEDTWISEKNVAQSIANRINLEQQQYEDRNELWNSYEFVDYLEERVAQSTFMQEIFQRDVNIDIEEFFELFYSNAGELKGHLLNTDAWFKLSSEYEVGDVIVGTVNNVHDKYGLFVDLVKTPHSTATGLLHRDKLAERSLDHFSSGDKINVVLNTLEPEEERASLDFAQTNEDG